MRQRHHCRLRRRFFRDQSAAAQTQPTLPPPPENLAAARELIQVMKATDQFKALLPTIMQALKPAFVQGRPEMEKDFDAILPAINDVAARRVNELAEALAVIYASNFSVAEIHDIAAFYRSPTGQKLLAQQPVIARESLVAGQQVGADALVGTQRGDRRASCASADTPTDGGAQRAVHRLRSTVLDEMTMKSAVDHTEVVIHCSSFCFGAAPTWREAS